MTRCGLAFRFGTGTLRANAHPRAISRGCRCARGGRCWRAPPSPPRFSPRLRHPARGSSCDKRKCCCSCCAHAWTHKTFDKVIASCKIIHAFVQHISKSTKLFRSLRDVQVRTRFFSPFLLQVSEPKAWLGNLAKLTAAPHRSPPILPKPAKQSTTAGWSH